MLERIVVQSLWRATAGRVQARLLCVGTVLVVGTALQAAVYEPGDVYFGRNDYIEYRAGNLPLILTAGHGGLLTPDEIPDRTWGVSAYDTNTRQLTEAMAEEITRRTGKYPHVVISHLRRSKLDLNREIVEAAQGSEFAEVAWEEYHGFIRSARAAADAAFGFGYVMDMHGHGHEIQRLELGYGLGNAELNLSDFDLELPGYGWNSSLRTLMLRRPGVSFPELLRGPRSLGDLLNDRGVASWPSSAYPSPDGAPFFSGGYTTREHTCFVDNGPINGVQIESNWVGIRDSAANRAAFAATIARVLQPYIYENYGYSLGTNGFYHLVATTDRVEKGAGPVPLQVVREGFNSFSSSMEIGFAGTAVEGIDFLVTNDTVSFSYGQAVANFSLLPLGPNGDAGDKTIEVQLMPEFRQTADVAPVILTLGDGFAQTVWVEATTPAVWENDGAGTFTLRRTSATESLTVNVEWGGSAVPGLDYDYARDLPEIVQFSAGLAEVDVAVKLVDDAIPEPEKEIVLRILPGTGYQRGQSAEASTRLIDDDAPRGIVAWYRGELDGNRLLDSSGYGYDATTLPAGRGPANVSDSEGQAFAFDGVESTVALPKVTLDSKAGFSLAFHFRIDPSSSTDEHNLVSYGVRGNPGSINVYLSSSSTLRTWLGAASSGSLDAAGTWINGEWRHYAVTVEPNGIKRVYIDGQSVRLGSGWIPPLDPDEILWVGWRRRGGEAGGFLGGSIRDFRVYNRALAASEVEAVATNRLTFDAWRREHDLSGASPLVDYDGDGLNLLLEYGLGAAPRAVAAPPRYKTRIDDDRLVLDFIQQPTAQDLAWRVEGSGDLVGSWETLAERPSNASVWSLAPGVTLDENDGLVSVQDRQPASESSMRLMRLQLDLGE